MTPDSIKNVKKIIMHPDPVLFGKRQNCVQSKPSGSIWLENDYQYDRPRVTRRVLQSIIF